jgi:hypothetical protein
MWIRFPEFYYTDYFYMNTTYYDAVVFVPKKNIVFFGWGLFANYNGKDISYKVAWRIGKDGVKSDEHEVSFLDSEKDPEKKWNTVDLRKLGVKPIRVSEGEHIHVMAKIVEGTDDARRCFYGYGGYRERICNIPNQEYDFDTDYSSENDNSTSADWG